MNLGAALTLLALAQPPRQGPDSLLIAELIRRSVPITLSASGLSGPGVDTLRAAIDRSQFVLLGEDHGFVDMDWLTGQVFRMAHARGFRHLVIENGPLATRELTRIIAGPGGEAAVGRFLQRYPWSIAFSMVEDVALYASVVKAAGPAALWGLDQEFAGSTPFLLDRLVQLAPNASAKALAVELAGQAKAADARMISEKNPSLMFMSNAKAEDLTELRRMFGSSPNAEVRSILDELVATIDIYRLNRQGQGYQSGLQRTALMKAHFARYYREAEARGERNPRAVFRFGANHMVQGTNFTGHFDLGTMAKELAALNGLGAYNLMVIMAGGEHNRFLPFVANEADKRKPYQALEELGPYASPFLAAAGEDQAVLISLAEVHGPANRGKFGPLSRDLERIILGFDAVLVIPKGHPATLFE